MQASTAPTGLPVYVGGRIAVVRLLLLSDGTRLRAGVYDQVPARPVLRLAGADAENGRGLSLVKALTGGRWWTEPEGGGKVVWVELGAERDVPQ